MPEGDSLRRAAARIGRPWSGEQVDVETPHPRAAALGLADRLTGRRLEARRRLGKNVLLRFEGGYVLRSHLRMSGRWTLVPRGSVRRGRPWLVLRGATRGGALERAGPRAHTRGSRGSAPTSSASHPTSPLSRREPAAGASRRARRRADRPAARRRDRQPLEGRVALAARVSPWLRSASRPTTSCAACRRAARHACIRRRAAQRAACTAAPAGRARAAASRSGRADRATTTERRTGARAVSGRDPAPRYGEGSRDAPRAAPARRPALLLPRGVRAAREPRRGWRRRSVRRRGACSRAGRRCTSTGR